MSKLKQMKDKESWEEGLNIDIRFNWATTEQRKHILAEIKYQRKQARNEAIKECEREKIYMTDIENVLHEKLCKLTPPINGEYPNTLVKNYAFDVIKELGKILPRADSTKH